MTIVKPSLVFREARVNAELGTVGCPNGADLDSDVLYAKISARREEPFPREHFPHDDTEGPDVGALINRLRGCLFR